MNNYDHIYIPPELWLHIFSFLPINVLKVVVLVCRTWRKMGEEPVLWKKMKLKVRRETQPILENVLSLRRLERLRSIKLSQDLEKYQAENFLRLVGGLEQIIILDMSCIKLTMVIPDTMGTLVRGLEELVLTGCDPTLHHLMKIFTVICNEDNKCKMQKLYIGYNNLSQLPPNMLAMCVTKPLTLHCNLAFLTNHQLEALLLAITQDNSRLRELHIGWNNFSSLSPRIISTGLSTLISVILGGIKLTRTKCCSFLSYQRGKLQIKRTGYRAQQPVQCAPKHFVFQSQQACFRRPQYL